MKTICKMVLILFALSNAHAGQKEGVAIADKIKIKGQELVLNGIGVRRATFFNIKVYVGGLYVSHKSKDMNEILNQPLPKYISMHFLRDVDKESLTDAWEEGFEAAVEKSKRKALMKSLQEFNNMMGDIKKGQSIQISFLKEGVIVSFNGKESGLIGDKNFSQALFSIWFVNARDEDLRDELLGKS